MKEFEFKLIQALSGMYEGTLIIEAETKEEAKIVFDSLSLSEIDDTVNWEHSDEYEGDYTTIELIDIEEI